MNEAFEEALEESLCKSDDHRKRAEIIWDAATAYAKAHYAPPADASERPIDVVLFCPECKFQHIDKAEPDKCESCGHRAEYHRGSECYLHDSDCDCTGFVAWLNPPHKKHRCHRCNHVFKPANVPTNGVAQIDSAEAGREK